MPKLLSPEEFDAQFGGGFRATAPEAGLGTRFGAGIDSAQAGLYGVGEAFGLPVGDLRRENEAEAEASRQRYFRDNPYEPQSYKDVNGLASGLRYVRGLAIDSAPYLAGSLAGGLVGGVPGAFAVGATMGTGDVLQNQREQAGQTNLLTALPLGAAYGAIDALTGVGGALARRTATTGIRGLDRLGTKALDNISGFKGGLARTGAAVAKEGFVEGLGETGQEVLNQMGRMAVDRDVGLLDPDALERYGESFVGGAALGGAFGGVMGGWRRSKDYEPTRTVDDGKFDLTQPGGGGSGGLAPPQYNLVTQPDPLQQRINQGLGIQRNTPKDYAKLFEGAASEGSGQFVTDPQTGQERELDMGEYYALQTGVQLADQAAQKQQQAQQQQLAAQEEIDATATSYGIKPVDIGGQVAFDVLGGRVYGQSTLNQVVSDLIASNQGKPEGQRIVEQAVINAGLVNFDGKPVGSAKQIASKVSSAIKSLNLHEATEPQAAAAILNDQIAQLVAAGKNEADPKLGKLAMAYEALTEGQTPPALAPAPSEAKNAGQTSVSGQPAAPSVATGNPVVPGSVANPGSVPAGNAGLDRNAPGAGVGSQPAGPVASGPGEQAAPVGAPAAAPAVTPVTGPEVESWEDYKPDNAMNFDALPDNQKDIWRKALDARASGERVNLFKIAEELATENVAGDPRMTALTKVFGERNAAIIFDHIALGLSQQQIADKLGVTQQAISKIVGPKARAEWASKIEAAGMTTQELADVMSTKPSEAAGGRSEVESEIFGGGGARNMFEVTEGVDEGAAIEANLNNFVDTAGGSKAAVEGFTDLQDQVFATLEKLRAEEAKGDKADPKVIEELNQALQAGIEGVKQVEAKAAAEVRANAGKESKKDKSDASTARRESPKAVDEEAATEEAVSDELKSDFDQARDAWDNVAAAVAGAPMFDDLTRDQQETFVDYGPENWSRKDVMTELKKLSDSGMKFGKDGRVDNPYTAKELLADIKGFVRSDIPGRKLLIVDTVADLINHPDERVRRVGVEIGLNRAYGVAVDGRAFLVADRITKGQGRAKFMHEVGGHLGLEGLLPKALYNKLTSQLLEWAKKEDGSIESKLALKAAERVMNAGTPKEDQRSELLAYFLEEAVKAGIDPTASVKESSALRDWFRTLWAAFKVAVRKLGFKPETLTAQDVVDMAFGAARLEIAGTFHGTAAQFRKFNHKFMGSGEGAQAYGWGTYLAQRAGIAKGYWSADVDRKSGVSDNPDYRVGDKTYSYSDGAPEQAQIDYFAAVWLANPPKLIPGGSVDANLAAMAKRATDPFEKKSIELARTWNAEGKKAAAVQNARPDGALMRVDIAIPEGELLDWDNELSTRPEVLAKIKEGLPESLRQQIEEEANLDLADMTGEDFYRALEFIEKRDGAVSEQFDPEDYNSRLANKPAKQVVSTFIDEKLGVGGLRFLDAKSRGQARIEERIAQAERKLASEEKSLRELKAQLARERQELVDRLADAEAKLAAGEPFARVTVEQAKRFIGYFDDPKGSNALLLSVAEKDVQLAKDNLAKQRARAASPVTRNLVIFNEANIFRVGSAIGADKQRMKFGIGESQPENKVTQTINRLPPQARAPVGNTWRNLSRWTRKGLDRVVFTADLLQAAAKQGLTSAIKFQRLLELRGAMARDIEIDVEKVADLYAAVPENERGVGPGSVNEFIFDSTRTGKWGYDSGSFKADGDMAKRFDALSEESRRFVEAVFDHGKQMLALKKQTVLDSTRSIYDALIAKETDPKAKAKLEREKAAELSKFQRLFAIREGLPYAPIKRVGDYVVIAKSDAYLKAEEEGNAAELRKLEKDPDHYHVSFMESENEAARLQEQLEEQGFFKRGSVEYAEKEMLRDRLFGGESMLNAVTKLKGMVDAQIDDDTSKQEKATVAKMQRLVSDLYLQTLAENSARKTEMRRRGVAGEVDMLKSFTMQGRADAQFLASVKYASPTQDVIQEMRKQVKSGGAGTRNRRSELFNEIMARYAQTLDYSPTPVADKLNRLSSIWYLATSPAYYLQNLTQPFMLSLPVMSGRHDYTRSANELLRAYNELTPLMKSAAKGFNQQLDYTKLPKDVQTVIGELVKRGRVDIGIDTELGRFEVEGDSKLGAGWNKVDKFMRSASQKLEAMNRLSTAMAAYRLELQKSNSVEKATEYADRILTETHGDYTRFNAPRAFNTSVGKVMLQFRKYQLIQLTLLAKLFKEAGFSTAEKRAAAKALAFTLGHTGVMAGVTGVPGYAAISTILGALLSDDDDKFDLTQKLRELIGDEDLATLILKGAPARAGVDLSGKLGMGNALSVLPFTDVNPLDRRSLAEALGTLVSGPAGGLVFRAADGVGLIANGNYYKGIEMLMPTGLSNMMKAYRIGNEGVTRRNGDLVMSADEVSFAESVAQALGFTPTDQVVRSERAQFVREVDQGFQDRSKQIKNDYAKAAKQGDAEGKAEARDAWKQLQERRREKGYTPQPLSELLKAPQQQVKRERQVAEGVPFNKQNKRFVQQLVEN